MADESQVPWDGSSRWGREDPAHRFQPDLAELLSRWYWEARGNQADAERNRKSMPPWQTPGEQRA